MQNPDPVLINNWYVVANVEECKPGSISTARLLGINLVLWRGDEPDSPIQVWQDYCPHRGVQLSLGEITNNRLACPYHGWQYNTAGKCVHIPAHPDKEPPAGAKAKAYQCQERYGLVWVCLGQPANDIPVFPEWDDAKYDKTYTKTYTVKASAFRMMENFLDVAHFPILHDGWLGDRNQAQMENFEVKLNKDGIKMHNFKLQMPRFNENNETDSSINSQIINHPLCQYWISESDDLRATDFLVVTPIDEDNCIVRMLMTWSRSTTLDSKELEAQMLTEFNETVEQDMQILHAQQPTRLPLLGTKWMSTHGLPHEVHMPSDQCTVTYRKWLKELGVTYGVC
ncbi:MAG: aromatic ring-hydroxylating dioxygenase subunit alpha [Pseudomonadota bacterium]